MAVEFIMPKLGLTMEQGTISNWLVADGASVSTGDAVAVVETDKVETEIECSGTGVLRFVGTVGTTYDCGALIGWICEPGEAVPTAGAGVGPSGQPTASVAVPSSAAQPSNVAAAGHASTTHVEGGRRSASPNARRVAAQLGVPLAAVAGTGPEGRIVSEDVERASAAGVSHASVSRGTLASPPTQGVPGAWATVNGATFAAVQFARMLGLDPAEVPTDAPDGVVTREDVAEFARALINRVKSGSANPPSPISQPSAPAAASTASSPLPATGLTPMRRVIAQRMTESLQGMAQLTLLMDVDMAVVMADRRRRMGEGTPPGYTDYVVAAVGVALQRKPYVNASFTDAGIVLHDEIHVGMAVAVDGGLFVPVVRDTTSLSLEHLSGETTRLATAARAGKLSLSELQGGTCSVSALGMYGVDGFTPIINPPNAAIVGVGRIRTDVAWVDGAAAPVSRLTLSLTWDHRVFDGAPAAEFAREVKTVLEDAAHWADA